MHTEHLRIDPADLLQRLQMLGRVGAIGDGGCCRLAFTDADRAGRDLVCGWMRELGLRVQVDPVGNIFGWRDGLEDLSPVMAGSHIDTVATGGRFDGNYGVLSGLTVVHALNTAGITTRHPLVVAVFTNEDGARFQPDMLGSLVYAGGLSLAEAHATRAIDGAVFADELQRIGYLGTALAVDAAAGLRRAAHRARSCAVHNVQGISWQALSITGQSNHAGTTPMRLRHDAGHCAASHRLLRAPPRRRNGRQPGRHGGRPDDQRCALCHNAALHQKNVSLHTPELIKQHAQAVYQQAAVLKLMPLNDATKVTDDELYLIKPGSSPAHPSTEFRWGRGAASLFTPIHP